MFAFYLACSAVLCFGWLVISTNRVRGVAILPRTEIRLTFTRPVMHWKMFSTSFELMYNWKLDRFGWRINIQNLCACGIDGSRG